MNYPQIKNSECKLILKQMEEYSLNNYMELLKVYLEEARKYDNYLPDFSWTSEQIRDWFKIPEHKLMHRNQSERLSYLFSELSDAWNELLAER